MPNPRKTLSGKIIMEEICPVLKKVAGSGEIRIIYTKIDSENMAQLGTNENLRVCSVVCPYYDFSTCRASPIPENHCGFYKA